MVRIHAEQDARSDDEHKNGNQIFLWNKINNKWPDEIEVLFHTNGPKVRKRIAPTLRMNGVKI
jgi:hypothetical protein